MPAKQVNRLQPDEPERIYAVRAVGPPHLRAVTALPVADEMIPNPPERFVRALAAHAFEAVEGTRTISQLGTAITFGAARQLAEQRSTLSQRRSVYNDQRASAASPGRLHLCRVLPRLAEASVTMHTGQRSYAVALRLEWSHGRWRASEVYVL